MLFLLVGSNVSQAFAYTGGSDVKKPTMEAIVNFALEHPTGLMGLDTTGKVVDNYKVPYLVVPILTAPYFPGLLDDEENTNALNVIKTIRFIAGINHDVELNYEYSEKAQAACIVNYANGNLSHYPKYPANMNGKISTLGVEASKDCNLAKYTRANASLKFAILDGWMSDSDPANISTLGHRRWILNPLMGAVGFGIVSSEEDNVTYNAMYVSDESCRDDDYAGVCWPAQNMPVSYFKAGDAWSISMNETLNPNNIKVRLTKIDDFSSYDLKHWVFSSVASDGEFFVSNNHYGQTGCIIFRPDDIEKYSPGDKYLVSISGLDQEKSYTVEFFDLENFYKTEKPKLSSVSLDSDKTPVIEWDKVNNADTYDVYRCIRGSGGKYIKIASDIKETFYTDKTARPGIKYFYKVTAIREVTGRRYESIKSGYLRGVTVPLGSVTITKLRSSSKSVFIDWDKVDGRTGYRVFRKAAGASKYSRIADVKSSYYYDKTAVRGKKYTYRVRAYKTINGYTVNGKYSATVRAGRL